MKFSKDEVANGGGEKLRGVSCHVLHNDLGIYDLETYIRVKEIERLSG
jgi:hypothetical protein